MTQCLNFALKLIRKEQKDEVWMANLDDGIWKFTLLFFIYLYMPQIFIIIITTIITMGTP